MKRHFYKIVFLIVPIIVGTKETNWCFMQVWEGKFLQNDNPDIKTSSLAGGIKS